MLFETKNLIPLIDYIPYEINATDNYTNEQREFSEEIIEQWSNFIKYGQPNSSRFENQWIPIGNISNGFIMHLKMNQSEVKQFEIPANVLFWTKTCLTVENNTGVDLDNQVLFYEISFAVFISTSVFLVSHSSFEEIIFVNQ